MQSFLRKRVAFTLAEVLITLGIVGVVAAMVLPAYLIKLEKQRNLSALKRAYSDLHQYLRDFDYENDCNGVLLSCTYTPPTGDPVFVRRFSQYLVEKQNFKPLTTRCWRVPARPHGTIYSGSPYFLSCPVGDPYPSYYLISPSGQYAYWIGNYMHDNFYQEAREKGTFRARMAIFTDPHYFKPCKLNCTKDEYANSAEVGKNIFKLFITDKEYIVPQGGCKRSDYYCGPLNDNNCSKEKNNYEACFQKIINDGWQIKYY